MNKISKKTALILMIIGIFVIAISQIITHFAELQDGTKGLIVRIGLGFLILSVIFGQMKAA